MKFLFNQTLLFLLVFLSCGGSFLRAEDAAEELDLLLLKDELLSFIDTIDAIDPGRANVFSGQSIPRPKDLMHFIIPHFEHLSDLNVLILKKACTIDSKIDELDINITLSGPITIDIAAIGFTICDKVDNACQSLKFTICDKIERVIACDPIPIFGQTTITDAGVYCLTTTAETNGDVAIKIAASKVTLDLNGHTVLGTGGAASKRH